jgi:flagellar basal-body rod modification protein FlgD
MLEGITGITTFNEPDASTEKKTDELGRDNFLTMFMAQLKYQDPLNPMDGQEFAAQLAQFSSLEQLFNVNDNLESMKTSEDQNAKFQALDLIGKEISAGGDILSLVEDQTAKGGFTLDSKAYCTATIYNENGMPVKQMYLGVLEPGAHQFEWDGLDDNGTPAAAGTYGFDISATTEMGDVLPVETQVVGQVTRINLEGTSPILYMGDLAVDISQVLDIKVPEVSDDPV